MGIFGAQIACQMTFISIGNAGASIIVAIMRKFVLLLPLIYLLPHLVKKSDHGRVSGRAGSGCDRGKLYACSVFLPVQKGDCCHREAAIAGRAFFLLLLPEVLKCGGNFAMMK